MRELNVVDFNIASKLVWLEELYVHDCSLDHFKLPSRLRIMGLSATKINNFDWMYGYYPDLSEIVLDIINQWNDQMLIEFQLLNPQLTGFGIYSTSVTSSSVLPEIAIRLPNLTIIKYIFHFDHSNVVLQRKL